MGKHEKERDGFKSRTGFVLACIGSAVGMGNIWRFPYMVSDWGGMTFLLPYILFVILIASTGVIEEMALGRAAKGGPIIAFGNCTEMRTGNAKVGNTIGWIPVLGSLAMAIGYTVIVGWIVRCGGIVMQEYELKILDRYALNVKSTRRVRGAFFCEAEEGLFLLKEAGISEKRADALYKLGEMLIAAGYRGIDQFWNASVIELNK